MSTERRLIVEADGGSRGNPGPAAYGALVRDADTGEVLAEIADTIGIATNNVAEYRGVIAGLRAARDVDSEAPVEVRLDSKLVVEQLSGNWRIKHANLQPLAIEAQRLIPRSQVRYVWVPRNQNTHADKLVNLALDGEPISSATPRPSAVAPAVPPSPPGLVSVATLVLVRHGQTVDTLAGRFSGGSVDGAALDDAGRRQAERVAGVLADSGAATIVASPTARTAETAQIVADQLGLTVSLDSAWRECDFGLWEGLTVAEVTERYPDEVAAWRASTASSAPQGESLDLMAKRVLTARDAVVAAHAGETVVVVTHSMPIRAVVAATLDAPPSAMHRLRPSPGSLTEIRTFADGSVAVTGFSRQP